jgi:hypothetical protein
VIDVAVSETAPPRTRRRDVGTAVASVAIRGLLAGAPRPGRVLGTSTHGWWYAIDDTVVVVTDDRVVRLPNAVVVRPDPAAVAGVSRPGEESWLGGGGVATPDIEWRIVRWFDPRVAAIDADPNVVAGLVRSAAELVPGVDVGPLAAALRTGDGLRFVDEAGQMIGRGEGLTPEGDDILTGVVAGYRHCCASLGDAAGASMLERLRRPILSAARRSTTSLSVTLLGHAFDGEVAAPVGSLLRALTGRGSVPVAIDATLAVGHRSGPALAGGVVAGVAAGLGVQP